MQSTTERRKKKRKEKNGTRKEGEKIPYMLRGQIFQHLKLIVELPHFSHS